MKNIILHKVVYVWMIQPMQVANEANSGKLEKTIS